MANIESTQPADQRVAIQIRNLLRDMKEDGKIVIDSNERIQWQLANVNEDDNIEPGEKRYE